MSSDAQHSGDLIPAAAFALVAPDGVTPEVVRAYHDHLRERERRVGPDGTTPLSARLDTEAAIEQSVPGEVVDVTSRIEDELLAHLEPSALVSILEPPGRGFVRVTDPDRLGALLDVIRHRRDAYLRERDGPTPDGSGRVVTPDIAFEADYVAPLSFAARRDDCGVQWEFFGDDDLREDPWRRVGRRSPSPQSGSRQSQQ